MINKKIFILLGIATLLFSTSCDDDEDTIYGNWVNNTQFNGDKRSGAASFVIDETVYLGLGYNGSRTSGEQYFFDFLSYSGGSSWTPVDPFPGKGRSDAFAFSIDGKGYVGCGFYGDKEDVYYSDVWEFDPNADSAFQWTQLPNFAGGELTEMTSFVVGGKAYVTGGRYESDDTRKDCYEFNPASGTFTELKEDGINYKRAGAFSFVIGDKAYIGGGYNSGFVNEFECFDSSTESWLPINSLRDLYLNSDITDDISHYDDPINLTRAFAVTFVVDGKGYIASGSGSGGYLNDCWEYNPTTDLWTEKNSFEYKMNARYKANSFVLNEVPYVMLGQSSSSTYLEDMWSFEPNEEEDEND